MVEHVVTIRRTETCQYCGTDYEVPEGMRGLVESTRDMQPPAEVAVWSTPQGKRIPEDWSEHRILHRCKRGVPL